MKAISKVIAAIFFISIIIIFIFCIAELKHSRDVFDDDMARMMSEHEREWEKEKNMYQNYTEDEEILSFYHNITAIYPYLDAQGRLLFEYNSRLIQNISKETFNKTKIQYELCILINKYVMENITRYDDLFREKYSLTYLSDYDDVIWYAEYSIASENSNHEGILLNWTADLEEIKIQLDFIEIILLEIDDI